MKVSVSYCEDVLKTLPVGYYLGHPVTMKLDTKGNDTFINMENESITVSYNNIAEMCKNAPEDIDKESIIRSLFYHEISHAILTPCPKALEDAFDTFKRCYKLTPAQSEYVRSISPTLFNIFEDERIETLLADYYMNVNFKRNVILMNNIDPYKEQYYPDPIKKFFVLTRYRVGPQELVDRVQSIIKEYAEIKATGISSRKSWSRDFKNNDIRSAICNYCYEIIRLFLDLNPDVQNNLAQAKRNTNDYDTKQNKSSAKPNAGDSCANCAENKSSANRTKNNSDANCTVKLSAEEAEQILGKIEQELQKNKIPVKLDNVRQIAKMSTTNVGASAVADRLNKILIAAMNKRKARSNGSHGYSGQIDPRACTNRDYKWFAKKSDGSSATKRFNKIHFNLFCDNSGSFSPSRSIMNGLILTLKKLAEKNHDFSVTIIHCEVGVYIPDQQDPYLNTKGGSQLKKEIKEIYNKVQMPNAENYNLVVFDGNMLAYVEDPYGKNFAAFNHQNCIVVSDTENEEYFKKYAPQAKCKFLTGDYAKQFEQTVLEQIERALA